jgi:hypothetical protein
VISNGKLIGGYRRIQDKAAAAIAFGPLAIVRSTLLGRWPSVETIRLLDPSLSKNTPSRASAA